MPSINLTDDQLAVLTAAVRAWLDADEALGLIAANTGSEYNTMDPVARQYLSGLIADLRAVASEHEGSTGLPPVLAERVHVLDEVGRYARRARSAEEVGEWCDLNARLIRAAEEL